MTHTPLSPEPAADDEDTLIDGSPCIGVCRLGDDDCCEGCKRSRAEIAGWSGFSAAQRDAVNRRILPLAHPAVSVRLLGHANGRQPRRGGRRNRRS